MIRTTRQLRFCLTGVVLGSWVALSSGACWRPAIAQPIPTPSPSPTLPNKPAAPYVPTPDAVVTKMLQLAGVKQGDILYDLGSGDGRLVIAAVQQFGAQRGIGIEIAPELIKLSQANAQRAGVSDRTQFLQQDLFQTDFRDASVVTLYLSPTANRQLRPKLLNDLKPGSRIVSHSFTMGDWQPDRVVNIPGDVRTLYYWVVPAQVAGLWQGKAELSLNQAHDRVPYTLQFKQKFQQLEVQLTPAGKASSTYRGKLEGNAIRCQGAKAANGHVLEFVGQMTGNTLEGTIEVEIDSVVQRLPISAQRR